MTLGHIDGQPARMSPPCERHRLAGFVGECICPASTDDSQLATALAEVARLRTEIARITQQINTAFPGFFDHNWTSET